MKTESLQKLIAMFRPVSIRIVDTNQNEIARFSNDRQGDRAVAYVEALKQECKISIIEYRCNFDRFDIITR